MLLTLFIVQLYVLGAVWSSIGTQKAYGVFFGEIHGLSSDIFNCHGPNFSQTSLNFFFSFFFFFCFNFVLLLPLLKCMHNFRCTYKIDSRWRQIFIAGIVVIFFLQILCWLIFSRRLWRNIILLFL